ncbi:protein DETOXIFICATION 24-like [Syzygium oleosum]|uniref:protein DETOXIFICATION 24-like n=1 Tax=Syzygium oleosum TaxID=219896 RepID=UPI0024BB0ED0|nr:protein DETOXIFICATION 24-like [Syzygium oleosum]XP_056177445.1 protein DETOXIFICATION 24-like [Syzygium oleosum]XP_056177446.1 protein DETOXIFICATION 24-like [Syzygium oleosum]XP_056177448.1 protein DETOXIFICATION 24-like [Syzygium oleosum]
MDQRMEERLLGSEDEAKTRGLRWRIWDETKTMWRIAFPAILSRVTLFGIIIVTQAFIGHISALQFAAFAIVQTILVRFVSGVTLGMSSATETLCGQAFGAKQYHMMGIYLQRSWIVSTAATTILIPAFIFATPVFTLLGEDASIADEAEPVALGLIPVMYSTVFSATIQMFLQAQQRNSIVIWFAAVSFLLHLLLSWLFVMKLDWGLAGALGAMNVSCWSMVAAEFVYIFGGWCGETWQGFSTAAFSSLWPVVKLSVSSGVMLCLELWYNSVLVLLAGYMENATVTISTFSICLSIAAWILMIGLGFLVAASVRVSNELGRGNTKAAKFAIKVIFSTATCFGLVCAVLCLLYSYQIANLFTSNEEVDESVSELSYLLALSVFLNTVQPVLTGVAIGAGWQSGVAFVNIGCYYLIGVPIGAVLGYVAHLEVKGIWIGMICGVTSQLLALVYMTWKTNWDEQVIRASERLNRWLLKPSEMSSQNTGNSTED